MGRSDKAHLFIFGNGSEAFCSVKQEPAVKVPVEFESGRKGVHHRKPFDAFGQVVQKVAVNGYRRVRKDDPFRIDVLQRAVPVATMTPAESVVFELRFPLVEAWIFFFENENVKLPHRHAATRS